MKQLAPGHAWEAWPCAARICLWCRLSAYLLGVGSRSSLPSESLGLVELDLEGAVVGRGLAGAPAAQRLRLRGVQHLVGAAAHGQSGAGGAHRRAAHGCTEATHTDGTGSRHARKKRVDG